VAATTQLSPAGIPGRRYSFVAKEASSFVVSAVCKISASGGTVVIKAIEGAKKISAMSGTTKISARVN